MISSSPAMEPNAEDIASRGLQGLIGSNVIGPFSLVGDEVFGVSGVTMENISTYSVEPRFCLVNLGEHCDTGTRLHLAPDLTLANTREREGVAGVEGRKGNV